MVPAEKSRFRGRNEEIRADNGGKFTTSHIHKINAFRGYRLGRIEVLKRLCSRTGLWLSRLTESVRASPIRDGQFQFVPSLFSNPYATTELSERVQRREVGGFEPVYRQCLRRFNVDGSKRINRSPGNNTGAIWTENDDLLCKSDCGNVTKSAYRQRQAGIRSK